MASGAVSALLAVLYRKKVGAGTARQVSAGQLHYLDDGLNLAVCHGNYIILKVVWNRRFVVSTKLSWQWSETGGFSWQLHYLDNGLKPAFLSWQLHYLDSGLKPAVCLVNYIILKVAWNRRFVVSTTLSWQWSEAGGLSCQLHYLTDVFRTDWSQYPLISAISVSLQAWICRITGTSLADY